MPPGGQALSEYPFSMTGETRYRLLYLFSVQLKEGFDRSFGKGLHHPPSLCSLQSAYYFFS